MDDAMYQKIESQQRLSHEVASQIKSLIRSEQLRPGDKLPNELELSSLFGVSRPTVREAVKTLASQNIIEIQRGRGTYVSQTPGVSSDPLGLDFVTGSDLQLSLIEARLLIEPGVARLAAEKAEAADVQQLEGCVREMEASIHVQEDWITTELCFHRTLARITRNPVIMRLVPIVIDSILKTYRQAPRTAVDHEVALEEHRRIVESVRVRRPQQALEAMRDHLERSYQRTLHKRSQGSGPST